MSWEKVSVTARETCEKHRLNTGFMLLMYKYKRYIKNSRFTLEFRREKRQKGYFSFTSLEIRAGGTCCTGGMKTRPNS